MKRVLAAMLALGLVLGILPGCHKTPDSPIVIGKDNEKLIEKARAEGGAPFSAPERYSIETPLTNPQGNLTVHVDAAVIAPEAEGLSTARVEKHLFTEEECRTYAAALFEGQSTYSGEVFETKAYYQQRILEWQRQLASETDEQLKQQIQGSIEKFRMAMADLPEGEGLVETPVEFRTTLNGVPSMFLVSDGSDGIFRKLRILNNAGSNRYEFTYSVGRGNYAEIGNLWNTAVKNQVESGTAEVGSPALLLEPALTEEQAIEAANEMLSSMGVTDYVCKASTIVFGKINGTLQKAYRLGYTRVLGNNSFTLTSMQAGGSGWIDDGKGGFIEGWEYESLTFLVNDDGVVQMEWINPYDVSEVITDNTTMLSFSQVMDIFNKMIIVTNAYLGDDSSATIHVGRIELGLMRITDPATRSAGLVIPVWDFFGDITYASQNGEQAYCELNDDPLNSFLTINAIDGTLVDRGIGY